MKTFSSKDIILYPTDTIYGIGCDATSFDAVEKIFKLKKREKNKSLVVLVSSIEMLLKYVEVSKNILKIIKTYHRPISIIYKNVKGLSKNIYAKDGTVAIRVIKENIFCKKLIEEYSKPIASTSANISGKKYPLNFRDIDKKIIEGVDIVYKDDYENIKKDNLPSDIAKIENDRIIFIRKNNVPK